MIVAPEKYHELAASSVRPLDWDVGISFTKERNTEVAWFELDTSALDGGDLLAADLNNPIQLWDSYDYEHLRDRLVEMTISRSVAFPFNVQSSVADFTLDNHDRYLSYSEDGSLSPISDYIQPKRPCRLYIGFGDSGGVLPLFVGLTQGMPSYNGSRDETANITAMDFLSEIGDMSLNNLLMMQDARTDEVIAEILTQFGIGPEMYNLSPGINTIPFVYFKKGKNAGNALRELVMAENGSLWLDEQGIIRFEPRTGVIGKTPVMIFDEDNIVEITPSRTDGIVNTVKIKSEIRDVQEFQPIFSMENANGYSRAADEDDYRVGANRSADFWLTLDDLAWSATLPVFNGVTTSSRFTAVDLSGTAVSANVTAVGQLLSDTYKITVTNTNNFPISINALELWGEPAKVIDEISYDAYDEDSVEKFGTLALEINDNNCFGSYLNVDNFATDILEKYASYSPTIELTVKGNPALQMQDIITIDADIHDGDFLILGINHKLSSEGLETTITAQKTTVVMPFVLDVSILNGADVLG